MKLTKSTFIVKLLPLVAYLGFCLASCSSGGNPTAFQNSSLAVDSDLCRQAINDRPIISTSDPASALLSRGSAPPDSQDPALFLTVVDAISKGRYKVAASLYRKNWGYVNIPVDDRKDYALDYFFKSEFHQGYVQLYDLSFCEEISPLPPQFIDAGVPRPYERAIREAALGRSSEAAKSADQASSRTQAFLYGDILHGLICASLGRKTCAKHYWIAAASKQGYIWPETPINQDRETAVDLLLHFQP